MTSFNAENTTHESVLDDDINVSFNDSSVRVDVHLLDRLMNLVGELVLSRNQILQFTPTIKDGSFVGVSQRLNLITTELQESVMKTRMQPIGNVWNKLPRVVRELAVSCGKQIRIEMVGKDTELDRTIIEAIKDPLTHIVRNAVDHGIEIPELRASQGKPKTGTLMLRAFHEGGQVNIEVTDDGAGIDADKVKKRAVLNRLVTEDRASRLSDQELYQFIFEPGFSTAEKVSNVSGRGVGMDVVKTNIEKIGGTVDLLASRNKGTTIKIKIPLTLAIVPALIVASKGHRFAIPQVSLLELVRIESHEINKKIENIHGTPVYRLRGNLLPLIYLSKSLDLLFRNNSNKNSEEQSISIVVLQADDRQFGLVVDEVEDTEEIVVKPLGKELKMISVFAGATIVSDGGVALILDVMGLAQISGIVSRSRESLFVDATNGIANEHKQLSNKQRLLLFQVGNDARVGIPLSMVARLEEFPGSKFEHMGGHRVVQYCGEILPLIELSDVMGIREKQIKETDENIPVVVYSENGRSVGLVASKILDIVEDFLAVQGQGSRSGVLGAVVIQNKVTELLDVRAIIQQQYPSLLSEMRAS